MGKSYKIRDPIHGFITINEWERDIINHPVFQRLRRIRQLGLTDMVYPGAMHTRFEHSLGVMHTATRMFDSIVVHNAYFLKGAELNFNDTGLNRDRIIVRLAAGMPMPDQVLQLPPCPEREPWLAVVIIPAAYLIPTDFMHWVGDLERCLAWAIIEMAD